MHNQTKQMIFRLLLGLAFLSLIGCGEDTEPVNEPAGADESAQTEALEIGAAALQAQAPLQPMDVYLVGFHPSKDDPNQQMEAHHFCNQVNEDFAQCVLFDANTAAANLNGIEYIISERLFESLPEEEKQYWHPHNYEILSGQLVAPGLPDAAEKELMQGKINSYGKTWRLWRTGSAEQAGDNLPFGEAMLAWSFNHDGEANPRLLESRDQRMGIDTAAKRQARQDLIPLAKPQMGVNALQGQFPGETQALPGVVDKSGASSNDQPAE